MGLAGIYKNNVMTH